MNDANKGTLLATAMVLLGGVVGAVLAFSALTASDEDTTIRFPEAATQATPTPCENFEQASAFLVGVDSPVNAVFADTAGTVPRMVKLRQLYDKCLDYANE